MSKSSKQSEAKAAQGYAVTGPCCGSCKNFQSDFVPVPWMVRYNDEALAQGRTAPYNLMLSANKVEKNLRCGVGGFAVKKMAHCQQWGAKE